MAKISRELAVEQLRKAIQLLINTLDEDTALEVATVYPAWKVNTYYAKGQIISYGTNSVGDPQLYKVITGHTSQADWTPDTAASLFSAFGLDDDGYVIWAQPSGAHDAYKKGDIVNYKGTLYESLIDGNVWNPDVYAAGWKKKDAAGGADEGGGSESGDGEDERPQEYPDFVQPTGAHDAYHIGDIVKFNGLLYRSTIDNNVWSPTDYPGGWELYEEE